MTIHSAGVHGHFLYLHLLRSQGMWLSGRWHHRLNGREFEQTPGDSEGQGSPACCSAWGCRVGHDLTTTTQCRRGTQGWGRACEGEGVGPGQWGKGPVEEGRATCGADRQARE